MNKDVIYIEPEDDITDIITKIEKSKEKIIALVPPKKAGVFRSVVNIKLMTKSAKAANKTVVLVTVDPSITKLAAASRLPVAKNLQSAPSIPSVDDDTKETTTKDEVIDTTEDQKEEKDGAEPDDEKAAKAEKSEKKDKDDDNNNDNSDDEEDDEDDDEDLEPIRRKKEKKASKQGGNRFTTWIKNHKKLTIFAGIIVVGLIIFLVWAFAIAPAVDIDVAIKASSNNFSEGVSFVNNLAEEDAEKGKIYLEEKKIEEVQEVTFEATGTKNKGDKATGSVIVYVYFNAKGAYAINSGTAFTIGGLSYLSNSASTLQWDGNKSSCENDKVDDDDKNHVPVISDGVIKCLISGRINVTAEEAGAKYNIAASSVGWDTIANVAVYSDSAMTGGTDNVVTVVQQSDVENAKKKLTSTDEEKNKQKLYDTIDDDSIIMESTFKQEVSKAVATPAVDEEVKEGVQPSLKVTTVTSVMVIDKTKLEEFISYKVDLGDTKKIYDIRNVYIDGFTEVNGNYSGKLKATYFTGPKITETEVVEKIKGKGLGDAQREIRDIDGVSDVKINKSYPWVFTIPNDSNKISITFEVKDQDGQTLEEKNNIKTNEKANEEKSEDEDK